MKASEVFLNLGIAVFIIFIAYVALYPSHKPFERACPDRSETQEKLAYSTYYSDGRLECTYIPHGVYGKQTRKIAA